MIVGEAPFNVLGKCVVGVDAEGEVGELSELVRGEGGGGGLVGRERDLMNARGVRRNTRRVRGLTLRYRHDFVGFLAEALVAKGAGVFVDGELIDLAFAAYDGFAKAEVGVDEEFGEIAGNGIDGEGDAGGLG